MGHLPWRAALWAALALVIAGRASRAQVVRINELADQAYDLTVATDGRTAWFAFNNDTPSCAMQDWIHTRQAALDGTFLTPELLPFGSCNMPLANEQDLAMLPDGRFLLVREDGISRLLASRFDAAGVLVGADIDLDGTGADISDLEPRVIATEADRWTVVWADKSTRMVWARQVDATGGIGPKVLIDPAGFKVRVAQLGSGDIVMAWSRKLNAVDYDIVSRRFDLALSPISTELLVSQAPAVRTQHVGIGAGADRYTVAWESDDPPGTLRTYVRFLDVATGPIGNEVEPNNPGVSRPSGPRVAVDATGRSLVIWHELDLGVWQAWGRWYDRQAQPLSEPFRVNPSSWESGFLPDIAMLPGGDAVIAYQSQFGHVVFRRFFYPLSLAVAPGPGPGNAAEVRMHRPDGRPGAVIVPFASQSLGASVGSGQIDGDAGWEVLAGPGPSPVFGPHVRAFQPDATPIAKVSFYAYGTLRYGVKPGSGDVDGDGYAEVVTTPGPGAVFGPHVRGFDHDGAALAAMAKVSFFAFGTLRYGCNAATPELEADGFRELLAAPGPGAVFGAQVKGFDYDGTSVRAMGKVNAYAFPGSTHGATVAASDVESDWIGGYGDGYDELFVGRGPAVAWDAELRMLDYDGAALTQTYALTTAYASSFGIEPAGGDADAGDTGEVLTAPGPDPAAPARIRAWEWKQGWGGDPLGSELVLLGPDDFVAFPGYAYGGHVAVGTFE